MNYFTKQSLIDWEKRDVTFKETLVNELIGVNDIDSASNGNPSKFSTSIADTKEKACQRAILLNGESYFNGNEIKWIDIEVPVIPGGKARRQCLDLLGKSKNNYVIVELKVKNKNDKTSQCPLVGLSEILFYNYNLVKYNMDLKLHKNAKFENNDNIMHINNFLMNESLSIFAANTCYWDEWRQNSKILKSLKEIRNIISDKKGIYIYFAEFNDENFIEQKNVEKNYTPQLLSFESSHWKEV